MREPRPAHRWRRGVPSPRPSLQDGSARRRDDARAQRDAELPIRARFRLLIPAAPYRTVQCRTKQGNSIRQNRRTRHPAAARASAPVGLPTMSERRVAGTQVHTTTSAGVMGTSRRVTLNDVAAASGVSRATVSFVLNDDPHQTISAATRDRVKEAARTLGYVPHGVARALREGTSRVVVLNIDAGMEGAYSAATSTDSTRSWPPTTMSFWSDTATTPRSPSSRFSTSSSPAR